MEVLVSEEGQGIVKAPETLTETIADLLVRGPHVVPDQFAAYQFLRRFRPEGFQYFQEKGITNPYGEYRYGLAEMMLDLRSVLTRERTSINQGDQEADRRMNQFRIALLKLYEMIVAGQDPQSFDWENFSL
jgi:hypothetical protein